MGRYLIVAVVVGVILAVAALAIVSARPADNEFRPFQYAVFAWKELKVSGNVLVDSYSGSYSDKTARQDGHVRSNKFVQVRGSSKVCGSAWSAGRIEVKGKAQITGKQYPYSPLYETPRLKALFNKYSKASSNLNSEIRNSEKGGRPFKDTGDFVLSDNDCYTLAPGNYFFRSLRLTGGATLDVREWANIYVAGPVEVSGGSHVNCWLEDPLACLIMSQSGGITISGDSEVYAMIYAPDSAVAIEGSEVFGSVIGGEVNLEGDAQVHLSDKAKIYTIAVNVDTVEYSKVWPPSAPEKPVVSGLIVCPDPAKPLPVKTKRWYNIHLLDQSRQVIALGTFSAKSAPSLTQVKVKDKKLAEPVGITPKRLKYRMSCLGVGETTVHLEVTISGNVVSKDIELIQKKTKKK